MCSPLFLQLFLFGFGICRLHILSDCTSCYILSLACGLVTCPTFLCVCWYMLYFSLRNSFFVFWSNWWRYCTFVPLPPPYCYWWLIMKKHGWKLYRSPNPNPRGVYKKCNSAKLIWFEIFILHHYMWNVLLYFLTVLLITTCIFSAYFDLPLIYCLCDYYTMHNNCFKRVLCKREGGRMVYLFTLRKLFCTSQYEKNRTN